MTVGPKKVTTFYSDFELYETLRILAWHERRSISGMVGRLLIEALMKRKEGRLLPEEVLERPYVKDLVLSIGESYEQEEETIQGPGHSRR